MRIRQAKPAQALLEFALVITLVLLIVAGLFEFGHLVWTYASVIMGAREAARYAAAVGASPRDPTVPRYEDCAGIRDAALRLARSVGVGPDDIRIQYDRGPNTAVFAECPPGVDRIVLPEPKGARVLVTVQANYEPWVPLVPAVSMTLSSTAKRTILAQITVDHPAVWGGTGTPTATATLASTNTPTATATPTTTTTTTPTPTATTPPPTPTATATQTPTPTITPTPVALPPVNLRVTYRGLGRQCVLQSASWEPNPSWNQPAQSYRAQLVADFYLRDDLPAADPNATVWDFADMEIAHGNQVRITVYARFANDEISQTLDRLYRCWAGRLVEVTP